MGAVSVSLVKDREAWLGLGGAMVVADITLSSSYATGGDTWSAGNFRMGAVHAIQVCDPMPNGYGVQVDYTNKKVKAYTPSVAHNHTISGSGAAPAAYAQATGVGISADANGASITTGTAARTGITGIQNNAAAAASEVAAATDLSGVKFRAVVWGVL